MSCAPVIDAEHALPVGSQIPISRLVRGVRGALEARFVLAATRVTNHSDQLGLPIEFLDLQIHLPILFRKLIRFCPQRPDLHSHDIPHLEPRVANSARASRPDDIREEVSSLAQNVSLG